MATGEVALGVSSERNSSMMLIDSGANVHIVSKKVVEGLGLSMTGMKRGRVATADKGGALNTVGVVRLGGIVGEMQVADNADFNLMSVSKLQDSGVNVRFESVQNGGDCVLSKNGKDFRRVARDKNTGLHPVTIGDVLVWGRDQPVSQEQEQYMGMMARRTRPDIGRLGRSRTQEQLRAVKELVFRLHRCLGHANFRSLATAVRDGIIINAGVSYSDILLVYKYLDCPACALAKWTFESPESSLARPEIPFHTIALDMLGPYNPVARGGFDKVIVACCCATLFLMGKLVKRYNGGVLVGFLRQVIEFGKRRGFVVKKVRYDAGRVEGSSEVREFLSGQGIEGCAAVPEHQHQNPVERTVRTLKESVAANMVDQVSLNATYWGMNAMMTIQQRNCMAEWVRNRILAVFPIN
jgi:hypothetical protein